MVRWAVKVQLQGTQKKADEITKRWSQGIFLVELLCPQLGKQLPRERFENDTSLMHVIENNRMLESYLKIRQRIPREVSGLSMISQI
jgi:hypothetical protein